MFFTTVPYSADNSCEPVCPRIMQAVGQITPETPDLFLKFVREEMQRPGLMNVMLIHSNGGSVNASLSLGRTLRKFGTMVVVARAMSVTHLPPANAGIPQRSLPDHLRFVSGTCASACVYAFAGGEKRVVPPESRMAIHRMAGQVTSYMFGNGSYENQKVYAGDKELAALSSYIENMGVSTELVAMAESVPHEQARFLSGREISRLKLGSPKL